LSEVDPPPDLGASRPHRVGIQVITLGSVERS
jgi:hypothetical protein